MNKEQRKSWRIANPEKHREEQRLYYARHREEQRLRAKTYKSNNKNKCRQYNRKYVKEHPENARVNRHNYFTRKTQAGGSFTLKQWVELCQRFDFKCLRCKKKKKLTVDHVIPVSRGGTSDISNIQPLCINCNTSKGTRTVDYRV